MIDGDADDDRAADPVGVVVGLRRKGTLGAGGDLVAAGERLAATPKLSNVAQRGTLTYALDSGEHVTYSGTFRLNPDRTHVFYRREGSRSPRMLCRAGAVIRFEVAR